MSTFLVIESSIFQEAKVIKNDSNKAVFKMVMQTADEVNQNKRYYGLDVLKEAMKNCDTRMKRRSFLGELDHPCPSGNGVFDGVRQTSVQLKEASHLIRDYEFNGNNLIGELETTSTPNGFTLLGLLKDKCGIGLSMRGMAELDRQPKMNIVKSPLYIVTFDSVSMPSHKTATVDFNNLRFESLNVIQENHNCNTICTPDGQCFLMDYFDKLVETKMITFLDRWI